MAAGHIGAFRGAANGALSHTAFDRLDLPDYGDGNASNEAHVKGDDVEMTRTEGEKKRSDSHTRCRASLDEATRGRHRFSRRTQRRALRT